MVIASYVFLRNKNQKYLILGFYAKSVNPEWTCPQFSGVPRNIIKNRTSDLKANYVF